MTTAAHRTRAQKIRRQRQHDRRVAETRAALEAEQRDRQAREDWLRFLVARGVIARVPAAMTHDVEQHACDDVAVRDDGCCEEHLPSAAMTPAEQAEHCCPACGWTPSEDDLITSVRCVCGGPIVEIAEGAFCHVGTHGDDLPTDHVAELDEPECGDDDD